MRPRTGTPFKRSSRTPEEPVFLRVAQACWRQNAVAAFPLSGAGVEQAACVICLDLPDGPPVIVTVDGPIRASPGDCRAAPRLVLPSDGDGDGDGDGDEAVSSA
jgi:hypothetical protein